MSCRCTEDQMCLDHQREYNEEMQRIVAQKSHGPTLGGEDLSPDPETRRGQIRAVVMGEEDTDVHTVTIGGVTSPVKSPLVIHDRVGEIERPLIDTAHTLSMALAGQGKRALIELRAHIMDSVDAAADATIASDPYYTESEFCAEVASGRLKMEAIVKAYISKLAVTVKRWEVKHGRKR